MNLPPLPPPNRDRSRLDEYTASQLHFYGESCARMAREEERELAGIYRMERDAARAQNEHVLKVLVGIHALLPPNTIEADGKTYVFNDPNANETLRELKRRINAIEEEAAAAIRKDTPS